MALQLAVSQGAQAVAVINAAQADAARIDGAEVVVDYTTPDWKQSVETAVDMVFNLSPAGKVDLTDVAALVRAGGALISAAAPLPDDLPDHVRGLRMASHPDADQLAQIVALVDAGKVRPLVADVRPLDQVRAIHETALQGTLRGKTVIRIGATEESS